MKTQITYGIQKTPDILQEGVAATSKVPKINQTRHNRVGRSEIMREQRNKWNN